MACNYGHVDMVKLLLATEGIETNQAGFDAIGFCFPLAVCGLAIVRAWYA